jgi:hypothetical protein
MAVRLQDVFLILVVGIDSTANITHRNSEYTLPRRTLCTGTSPGARDGI